MPKLLTILSPGVLVPVAREGGSLVRSLGWARAGTVPLL